MHFGCCPCRNCYSSRTKQNILVRPYSIGLKKLIVLQYKSCFNSFCFFQERISCFCLVNNLSYPLVSTGAKNNSLSSMGGGVGKMTTPTSQCITIIVSAPVVFQYTMIRQHHQQARTSLTSLYSASSSGLYSHLLFSKKTTCIP